jgi:hypothetical protein
MFSSSLHALQACELQAAIHSIGARCKLSAQRMVHAVHGEGGNRKCSRGGALCVRRVAAAAVSAGESFDVDFLPAYLGEDTFTLAWASQKLALEKGEGRSAKGCFAVCRADQQDSLSRCHRPEEWRVVHQQFCRPCTGADCPPLQLS